MKRTAHKITAAILTAVCLLPAAQYTQGIRNSEAPEAFSVTAAAAGGILQSTATLTYDTSKYYTDSTGKWSVYLDTSQIVNGSCTAARAMIRMLLKPNTIQSNTTFTIPSHVTVTVKDSANHSYTKSVPVRSIGNLAFSPNNGTMTQQQASNLNYVSFPYTLKEIRCSAFTGSGLKSVYIPTNVNVVESNAFWDCSKLTAVNFANNAPTIFAFENCKNLSTFNGQNLLSYNSATGEPILYPTVLSELQAVSNGYTTICRCPAIKTYMDEFIRFIADQCVSQTDGKPIHIARAMHDWIVANTEYDNQYMISSKEVYSVFFQRRSGYSTTFSVCDGYAKAYQALMKAAGLKCEFVSGREAPDGSANHRWNWIEINGHKYQVDVCWDDCEGSYEYFMRSLDVISQSHIYNSIACANAGSNPKFYDAYDLGKVNDDNYVTDADATAIQNFLLHNITLSPDKQVMADVNMDGELDLSDAICLRQALIRKAPGQNVFDYLYLS